MNTVFTILGDTMDLTEAIPFLIAGAVFLIGLFAYNLKKTE